MSTILKTINSDDFSQDKAIEINGEAYDLPKRTGELDNKLSELEKRRETMKEYDFLSEIIGVIFGKEQTKKILKDGIKTNLDFMAAIYVTSMELIYEDKLKAQQEATDRKIEELSPLIDKIDKVVPLLNK